MLWKSIQVEMNEVSLNTTIADLEKMKRNRLQNTR